MKKILLILAILVAAGAAVGYYLYNKPRTGVAGLDPAHTVPAADLFNEFQSDENAANAKYLGKVVEVSGTVQTVDKDGSGNLSVAMETGSDAHFRSSFTTSESTRVRPSAASSTENTVWMDSPLAAFGRSISIPCETRIFAVTMKMMRSTSVTSTSGVTLMPAMSPSSSLLELAAMLSLPLRQPLGLPAAQRPGAT